MIASREAAFYNKEILKYPTGFEAIKNVVIDATTLTINDDDRYVLESGTVLSKINASTKVKPAPSSGLATADVVGILAYTIEFFGDEADHTVPGAAFFWNCIFDTSKLISYTNNAANIKTAMPSCDFQ
jgi:hypothetical protein